MDRSILVKNEECLQTLEGHSNWLTSSMYDIYDIKFICHIAYLVTIFFFDFQEQKTGRPSLLVLPGRLQRG